MNGTEPKINPFPGLRPFQEEERHLFFGREAQTVEMLQRLRHTRFLSAVGPSGSGKSSLVRAGLIPELHGGMLVKAGSSWEVLVMRPGGDPMENLAQQFAEKKLCDASLDPEEIQPFVQATLKRSALGLVEAVQHSALPSNTNLLLVVDQFEEIFRFGQGGLAQRDSAEGFVRMLLEGTQQEKIPIYVLLTMRSDFIGDCAQFRGLAEAINAGSYLIPRLTREQWRTAIDGPVKVGGGRIAPRLVQRLLNDAGDDPDQLPILQHALMRTWDFWAAQPPESGPIDLVHYEAVGGMENALSNHADKAYAELPSDRHRKIAEKLFKTLAEKSPNSRGIRRPASLAALEEIIEAGNDELRFVVNWFRQPGRNFLMPPPEVELKSDTVIDISHESLMRVWTRMRQWVEEESQSVEVFRRLEQRAELKRQGKEEFYSGPALQIALHWRQEHHPNAAWARHWHQAGNFAGATAFLDESRKRALRRKLTWCAVLAGTVIVLATALFARWDALRSKRLFASNNLAGRALQQLDVDPESGVWLAREAATESARVLPTGGSRDALRQALFASHLRRTLRADTNAAILALFSPGGDTLLSVGDGSTATLWNARTSMTNALLAGHTAGLIGGEFSRDGRLVVTVALDSNAIVWDAVTGGTIKKLPHPAHVTHAAFSPDGRWVVTACEDNAARIWDVATGANSVLAGHTGKVLYGVFSADGGRVATASEDQSARVWDVGTRQCLLTNPHPAGVTHVVFSPDGEWLATACADRRARIWTRAGATSTRIEHAAEIAAIAFSPDGTWLMSASHDGTARLHSVRDDISHVLGGHSAKVLNATFSPDGQYVVTASGDKTARIWAVADGSLDAILRGHEKQVNSAAFSPDGQFVVTSSHDGTVRVWEMPPGRHFQCGLSNIFRADISPDGSQVAVADNGGLVQIWDLASGRLASDLPGQSDVIAIRFSPAEFLALTSRNDASRLWNRATSRVVATLPSTVSLYPPAFHSNESFIAIPMAGGKVEIWNWKATNRVASLGASASYSAQGVAFSRDGRYLAAALEKNETGQGQVEVWDWMADSTKPVAALVNSFSPKLPSAQAVAFSPDGAQIAIGCQGGAVKLWEWRGHRLQNLAGHEESVNSVQFSGDGRFIVTASSDKTVRVWSSETALLLAVLRGHTSFVKAAAFAPDGRSVASVARNGRVIIFSTEACVPTSHLLRLAEERLQQTGTERKKFSP